MDSLIEYRHSNGERLIVSYSEKRAKKDAYNRNRGVARLKQAYKSGRITKQQVNRRGYNKFLEISKDIEVCISEQKIAEDSKWDGLKGYITNTDLDAERVIEEYHGLWVVERAFRVSKGTLEMRPMFHFTERRIEAHICICFIAYKVYKELERLIATNKIGMSVDQVLDTSNNSGEHSNRVLSAIVSLNFLLETVHINKNRKESASFLFCILWRISGSNR